MTHLRALKAPMSRRMYSQAHRNPNEPAADPAAPPPPPRPRASSGGGMGRTLLVAALGAVAGAMAIDAYTRLFKGKKSDGDGDGDGEGPKLQPNVIMPQVAAPAVIPMPMPYPTPMPGWGGGYGYGGPPQQQQAERNPGNSDRERVVAVKNRRSAMEELRNMKQDAFDKLCDKFMEGDD